MGRRIEVLSKCLKQVYKQQKLHSRSQEKGYKIQKGKT